MSKAGKASRKICVVPNCKNTSAICESFFCFPTLVEKRKLWFTAISIDPCHYSPKTVVFICSSHFDVI